MQNKVMQIVPEDVSAFAKEVDTSLSRSVSGESVNLGQFGGATVAADNDGEQEDAAGLDRVVRHNIPGRRNRI